MKKYQKCTIVLLLCLAIVITSNKISSVNNPIISSESACDPHIHIFNNKAYMYSSHDYSSTSTGYQMRDWQLWSSSDLVTWNKEAVLRPQDTYVSSSNSCWATDGAERNGKYYWYFSNHNINTGVAVSTNGPSGPYIDALKAPLLAQDLTPTEEYDPTVFIDDDNTPYIIFGYKAGYYIAKLNDDMISLAETPRLITIDNGWIDDANFIHKHNGIYYLNTHGAATRSYNRYATATNIYGPYTGRYLGPASSYPDGYLDHLTFFSWKNQNYYVYGSTTKRADGSTNYYYRNTKIGVCNYKDNGDISLDAFTASSVLGVGQFDAGWDPIQAEWYFEASDDITKGQNENGFEIKNLSNNSYLNYPNVKNMAPNTSISFYASSANSTAGTIEVHQDSTTGPLLGSCAVPKTGSWTTYQTVICNLNNSAGTKNLFFVFKGIGTKLLRLDWFKFEK